MANTKDNKEKGFKSAVFRKDNNDADTKIYEEEINGQRPDLTDNKPPMDIDIPKLVDNPVTDETFKGVPPSVKKGMYDGIHNIIKDDLSLKGATLKNKKDIKEFFQKECIGLGAGIQSKLGMGGGDSNGFSLLAVLLAMACNGVNDAVSQVLDIFEDVIDPDTLRNVIPRFMEIHGGGDGDTSAIIKDIADSVIGPKLNANMYDPITNIVDFYNNDKSSSNSNDGIGDSSVPEARKSHKGVDANGRRSGGERSGDKYVRKPHVRHGIPRGPDPRGYGEKEVTNRDNNRRNRNGTTGNNSNRNDKNGKPKIEVVRESLKKIVGDGWERSKLADVDLDISKLNSGLFKSDSIVETRDKPIDFDPDTINGGKRMDTSDAITLFDSAGSNGRRDKRGNKINDVITFTGSNNNHGLYSNIISDTNGPIKLGSTHTYDSMVGRDFI